MKLTKESIGLILIHLIVFVLILVFNNQFYCDCLLIGLIIFILGVIIWALAKTAMGKTAINITPEKFVSKGIYSKLRHPMYLALIIMFIGLCLMFNSIVGMVLLALGIIPWHIYRVKAEEKAMIDKFGDQYTEYIKRTWF